MQIINCQQLISNYFSYSKNKGNYSHLQYKIVIIPFFFCFQFKLNIFSIKLIGSIFIKKNVELKKKSQ